MYRLQNVCQHKRRTNFFIYIFTFACVGTAVINLPQNSPIHPHSLCNFLPIIAPQIHLIHDTYYFVIVNTNPSPDS